MLGSVHYLNLYTIIRQWCIIRGKTVPSLITKSQAAKRDNQEVTCLEIGHCISHVEQKCPKREEQVCNQYVHFTPTCQQSAPLALIGHNDMFIYALTERCLDTDDGGKLTHRRLNALNHVLTPCKYRFMCWSATNVNCSVHYSKTFLFNSVQLIHVTTLFSLWQPKNGHHSPFNTVGSKTFYDNLILFFSACSYMLGSLTR